MIISIQFLKISVSEIIRDTGDEREHAMENQGWKSGRRFEKKDLFGKFRGRWLAFLEEKKSFTNYSFFTFKFRSLCTSYAFVVVFRPYSLVSLLLDSISSDFPPTLGHGSLWLLAVLT